MNITSIQNVFAGLISLPIFSFHVQAVPAIVQQWIAAHPGQTALLVVDGVIVFTPAALTAPLLATMGFGASGPVAGMFLGFFSFLSFFLFHISRCFELLFDGLRSGLTFFGVGLVK